MAKGMPDLMRRARATKVKFGTVKKAAARANSPAPAAIAAIIAGAVAVTSNAADDLTTVSAQLAALRAEYAAHITAYNDLLAKLRASNVLAAA